MARSYRRDSRGRFSGGGGGGKATGGSLKARSSAKRSQAKLAAKDQADTSLSGSLSRRAQRAAVTRTGNAAATAKAANRTKLAGGRPAGTVGKTKGVQQERQAKPEPPKPVKARAQKTTRKVDEAKAIRIAGRIANLNARNIQGKDSKSKIKALNRSEVKQRAIEFLRGKKGVSQVTAAQVAKTINTRKVTTTGKSSGGVLRGKYDNLGQSRLRQQRSERMKSRFDSESVSRRTKRVTEANAMNRGGLSSIKTSRASEIYSQQRSGRMRKERGAEMPYGIRNAANAEKRANQLRRAKAGAPLGGAASRMVGRIASGVVRSSQSKGQQLRKAKAAAERVKLRPMQRSEAAYQKRKYGVNSTIKNPGRMSQRLPRVTNSLGERVAVRGNKASTRQAYRTRVAATLNQSRTGSVGMGVMRKNPRMQKVKTGMTQLSLTGNNQDLVRFKQVKPRRRR